MHIYLFSGHPEFYNPLFGGLMIGGVVLALLGMFIQDSYQLPKLILGRTVLVLGILSFAGSIGSIIGFQLHDQAVLKEATAARYGVQLNDDQAHDLLENRTDVTPSAGQPSTVFGTVSVIVNRQTVLATLYRMDGDVYVLGGSTEGVRELPLR